MGQWLLANSKRFFKFFIIFCHFKDKLVYLLLLGCRFNFGIHIWHFDCYLLRRLPISLLNMLLLRFPNFYLVFIKFLRAALSPHYLIILITYYNYFIPFIYIKNKFIANKLLFFIGKSNSMLPFPILNQIIFISNLNSQSIQYILFIFNANTSFFCLRNIIFISNLLWF